MNEFEYGNATLKVIVPSIKPFFHVENGKIVTGYAKISRVLDNLPRNTVFFAYNGYQIGTENSTGHYDGLLGYVQRGEADTMFQPYPSDGDRKNDFQFSFPIYESGFLSLYFVRFPVKKFNDLSRSLFDFNLSFSFVFFTTFLIVTTLIFYFFSLEFKEALLIIYRIMLKEHNLKIKHIKYRHVLTFVLLYYFLLNILIEQSVNTSLVVSQNPEYMDTIEDIYNKKDLMVHFMKAHYVLNYFKNHYGNQKLKEIYERSTKICKFCVHDQKDYLPFLYEENGPLIATPNHIIICEDYTAILLRKGACNLNHQYLVKFGVARVSPYFFKQLFSFIFRKGLDKSIIKVFDHKTMIFVETGMSLDIDRSVRGNVFGFMTNYNPTYKIFYVSFFYFSLFFAYILNFIYIWIVFAIQSKLKIIDKAEPEIEETL